MLTQNLNATIEGIATAVAVTNAGTLTLTGVQFSDTIPIKGREIFHYILLVDHWNNFFFLKKKGFNSFLTPPIQINSLDVVGGESGKLLATLGISIVNPSIIYGSLGDMGLDIYYQGKVFFFLSFFLSFFFFGN